MHTWEPLSKQGTSGSWSTQGLENAENHIWSRGPDARAALLDRWLRQRERRVMHTPCGGTRNVSVQKGYFSQILCKALNSGAWLLRRVFEDPHPFLLCAISSLLCFSPGLPALHLPQLPGSLMMQGAHMLFLTVVLYFSRRPRESALSY